jgi:hypothetical protein
LSKRQINIRLTIQCSFYTVFIFLLSSIFYSSTSLFFNRSCHLILYLFFPWVPWFYILFSYSWKTYHMYFVFQYLIPKRSGQRLRIIQSFSQEKNSYPFNKGLELFLEKSFLTIFIAIIQCTEYVDHQFDLTYKCIKVIYTSHLSTHSSQDLELILGIWVFPSTVVLRKNNSQGPFNA